MSHHRVFTPKYNPVNSLDFKSTQGVCRLAFIQTRLRFHVEEVADGHVSVGLSGAVTLHEEFFFSPGHVHLIEPGVSLVIYGGVRGCVPVMDELSLERRHREK